jgi:outer membrane protein
MILIANQAGTIAYAREGMDITSAVLEDLNHQYDNK